MAKPLRFEDVARLPKSDDNCAIALQDLEAGSAIDRKGFVFSTDFHVPEGHRLATGAVRRGQPLLSWGLPFGHAERDIAPGSYLCNEGVLSELRLRGWSRPLPPAPNFSDLRLFPYEVDGSKLRPGRQVSAVQPMFFRGFDRGDRRGVGTRNAIVILATSSRTASVANRIAERLRDAAAAVPAVDGIVAVTHTEGGSETRPNNEEIVLRTLAGFIVHPNVGAVMALDYGVEPINNSLLQDFMRRHDYPLEATPHHFLSIDSDLDKILREAHRRVSGWLKSLEGQSRSPQPVSRLKLALQCGGSDAFSGISGNPLAGQVARQLIAQGGTANLAETDELIGAESYLLSNVRGLETARRLIEKIERFKERVAWHGSSAEGNPSGGNRFRGLYNITLKSIGAALKRDPEVRLDYVIDYAERMSQAGFYFMDSPGNDLESVAGQVAAGANLIFFTTGNGSITNFPFVPTIKIMNTTRRYRLLSHEMDINAGAFLDGEPMETLSRRTFQSAIDVASGESSCGEKAGHSQVSIWRDWRQTEFRAPREAEPTFTGIPAARLAGKIRKSSQLPSERVGLILPTSLCSGQVAQMIADRLNRQPREEGGISRYAALVHTEGCGVSAGITESLYSRTLINYLRHPNTALALLLEHGCEKTHNAYFRQKLAEAGQDPARFGFASIQLDGGIARVAEKVQDWFESRKDRVGQGFRRVEGLDTLSVGLATPGQVDRRGAEVVAELARRLTDSGATIVLAEPGPDVLADWADRPRQPTLGYGEKAGTAGLHLMDSPTRDWSEILSGLGATGVHLILARCPGHPLNANPLVPTLLYTPSDRPGDWDLVLDETAGNAVDRLVRLILRTATGEIAPKSYQLGLIGFQITRGRWGVSL